MRVKLLSWQICKVPGSGHWKYRAGENDKAQSRTDASTESDTAKGSKVFTEHSDWLCAIGSAIPIPLLLIRWNRQEHPFCPDIKSSGWPLPKCNHLSNLSSIHCQEGTWQNPSSTRLCSQHHNFLSQIGVIGTEINSDRLKQDIVTHSNSPISVDRSEFQIPIVS